MKITTNFEYAKKKAEKEKEKRDNAGKKLWMVYKDNYAFPIFLFPVYWLALILEAIQKWESNLYQWSDNKAAKMANYIIPQFLSYDEDEDSYYFPVSFGYSNYYKCVPFWHRRWVKKFEYPLMEFIKTIYQKKGYDKMFYEQYGEEYVVFKKRCCQQALKGDK